MNEPQRRRRHPRRVVRVLVEYRSDTGSCRDFATTLGTGGMFIETDDPLPLHSRLKLAFRLAGFDELHEIEAKVAWSRRPLPGALAAPGMGIEFTDAAAVARLARALESLDA